MIDIVKYNVCLTIFAQKVRKKSERCKTYISDWVSVLFALLLQFFLLLLLANTAAIPTDHQACRYNFLPQISQKSVDARLVKIFCWEIAKLWLMEVRELKIQFSEGFYSSLKQSRLILLIWFIEVKILPYERKSIRRKKRVIIIIK